MSVRALWLCVAVGAGCGRSAPPPVHPVEPPGVRPVPGRCPRADKAHGLCEDGTASWYSDFLAGHRTASGEPYDPALLTAAHRKLPLGVMVRVVRVDDGRAVTVRVNDRGPYGRSHGIDLSRAAGETIGIIERGVVPVRIERLDADED